ncbi:hypothetical protein GUJ93_ZPchr0003g18580 [Zizania palustris]|uniref:Uncharacterized protein n=1 Tax=Zizania palustris TaxID=103762 RepID=A0A8J5RY65_ZIZPA|nr:hypothetical protein GUJ93_ZPchr0003g18580 [Zizania palustris]
MTKQVLADLQQAVANLRAYLGLAPMASTLSSFPHGATGFPTASSPPPRAASDSRRATVEALNPVLIKKVADQQGKVTLVGPSVNNATLTTNKRGMEQGALVAPSSIAVAGAQGGEGRDADGKRLHGCCFRRRGAARVELSGEVARLGPMSALAPGGSLSPPSPTQPPPSATNPSPPATSTGPPPAKLVPAWPKENWSSRAAKAARFQRSDAMTTFVPIAEDMQALADLQQAVANLQAYLGLAPVASTLPSFPYDATGFPTASSLSPIAVAGVQGDYEGGGDEGQDRKDDSTDGEEVVDSAIHSFSIFTDDDEAEPTPQTLPLPVDKEGAEPKEEEGYVGSGIRDQEGNDNDEDATLPTTGMVVTAFCCFRRRWATRLELSGEVARLGPMLLQLIHRNRHRALWGRDEDALEVMPAMCACCRRNRRPACQSLPGLPHAESGRRACSHKSFWLDTSASKTVPPICPHRIKPQKIQICHT